MSEQKNATITGTMLGREDHGIMTCFVYLDYGGVSQGFGGYALDAPVHINGEFQGRVGTMFGCEFICRLLETLDVESWEKLPGTPCRVEADNSKVHRIAHYLKDNWFRPEDIHDAD